MSGGWRPKVKARTFHNILLATFHHMAEGQDRARPGHENCGFNVSLAVFGHERGW